MIRSAATIATSGALWSVAGNAASQTVAFLVMLILARLLSPDSFGLVAMAMIAISLTQTIVENSFGEALIREPVLSRAHCNAAFLLVIASSFSLVALGATAAQAIARTFGNPEIEQLLYWLLPLTLMSGLTAVPTAIIRREVRLRELEVRNFASVIAGGLLGTWMAVTGFEAWALVGQLLVQQGVQMVLLWLLAGWRPGLSASRHEFADVWSYGCKIVGVKLLETTRQFLPRLVIGIFLEPRDVGLYHMAAKLPTTIEVVMLYPLVGVTLATAAKIQYDVRLLALLITRATRLMALVVVPSFVGLAVVAPDLIPILMGSVWAGASAPMQVLAVAGLANIVFVVNGPTMRAMNLVGWQIVVLASTVVLTLALLVVFARNGITFAAIAVLGGGFVGWFLHIFVFWRTTKISVWDQHRALLPALVGTAAMAVGIHCWRLALSDNLPAFVLLVSEISLGVIVYAMTVRLLDRKATNDLLHSLAHFLR